MVDVEVWNYMGMYNINPEDKEEELAPWQISSHLDGFPTVKPEMLNFTAAVR